MKKFFSNNLIDVLIEVAYLGIIFLVPIYFGFIFVTEHPFDLQKMLLFKILLIALVFLSLIKYLLIKDKREANVFIWKFTKRYWFWPSILLLFFLISIIWSVNSAISFWGSLDRQFGWVSLALFFLFSFFLSSNLLFFENRSKKIRTILLAASFSASLVSVYAILQFFGIDFLTWNEPAIITKRAFSTLGQPNFLGSFILLTMILPFYFIKKDNTILIKVLGILFFCLQFLALIFSGSRGAWVGFLVGLLFFLGYLFLKKKKIVLIFGGLAFIVLILISFLGSNNLSQRFQSSFDFSRGGASARISLWSASIDGIKKNPWGYGIENQKDILVNYYDVNWGTFNKVNVMFDRAHNVFLDILLEVGIIGLLLCCFFGLFIIKLLFDNIKNGKSERLSFIIFISLISYLVSLFLGFATIVSATYFWMFFSIIIILNFNRDELKIEFRNPDLNLKVVFVVLSFLALVGIYNQINNLKIDYYFLKGKQFFYHQEIPSSILVFSYLREAGPNNHQYYYKIIDLIFDNYLGFSDEASRALAQEEVFKINEIINSSSDYSFSFLLAKAQSLAIIGEADKANIMFSKLEKMASRYPNIYYKKAKNNVLEGNIDEALINYNQVLQLLPEEYKIEGDINLRAFKNYQELIKKEINLIK
ncbi:MAG TPA: O-antigen ligase family protein [bacterium]|nr:O-antigen ligase family protein [bacterium]